jgi:hypothetical protein
LLLSGVAGVVVAGLWTLTNHAAAYHNDNVLQANLLALPLLWLVTRLVLGSRRAGRVAFALALLMAVLAIGGLLLKLLPGLDQDNGAVIALALPTHLGVAAAVWRLAKAG